MEPVARPIASISAAAQRAMGVEVFSVVRHHAIDLAGDALVFSGGRVEEADFEMAARPHTATTRRTGNQCDSVRRAAIRETREGVRRSAASSASIEGAHRHCHP
jgi:hypothetical protein